MKCMICNSRADFYLTKDFDQSSDFEKTFNLGNVDYWKCSMCGFVQSKTHLEMDEKEWFEINNKFHSYIENPANKKIGNQPPYLTQAVLLNVLIKNNILSSEILDWGGGYGTFSKILLKYFNVSIDVFEKYMIPSDGSSSVTYMEQVKHQYPTVMCSAVFEHVTDRRYLDEINQSVTENGNLILHTVVCENIPKDPNWFYLLPVHCAFHTNKSMNHLMKQWGYRCSMYCLDAKCWVLTRQKYSELQKSIDAINEEMQKEYLICSDDFVDYWK